MAATSAKIRAGFIGLGGFAAARRRWVRQSEAFQIVGGFDIRPQAVSEAVREEGPLFAPAGSIEELIARPELDIIFICTPALLHVEQAMIAAQAGKHLFVEKPLGHDPDEARRLCDLCERRHLTLGVGFSSRHCPGALVCKQYIDSGKLGLVVAADMVTMHCGGLIYPRDNWRFDPRRNPGGPLLHLGSHCLDLARCWFGEGKFIGAVARSGISDKPTCDAITVLLRYGEVPVTLHCHYVTAYRHYVQIFGTEGNLYYCMEPPGVGFQKQRSGEEEPIEALALPEDTGEVQAMSRLADAIRNGRRYEPDGKGALAGLELIYDIVQPNLPRQRA